MPSTTQDRRSGVRLSVPPQVPPASRTEAALAGEELGLQAGDWVPLVLALWALPVGVRLRAGGTVSLVPSGGLPGSVIHRPRASEALCALQRGRCQVVCCLPEDNGKLPLSSPGS